MGFDRPPTNEDFDRVMKYFDNTDVIKKYHKELFDIMGKGVWVYEVTIGSNIKSLAGIDPMYVPLHSVPMLGTNHSLYRWVEDYSERGVPILAAIIQYYEIVYTSSGYVRVATSWKTASATLSPESINDDCEAL